MTANTLKRIAILAGVAVATWAVGGCREDVRLAGRNLRSPTVGPVEYYDAEKLGPGAPPEDVAYVLLRAIRDDFQASNKAEWESALDKQFDLCAANVIASRNTTARPREEFIYKVVWHWTPTVSHYVHDFETDIEKAKQRFVVRMPEAPEGSVVEPQECEVLMEVADPSGDPNARVVMVIYLAKDSSYWRVVHLGFDFNLNARGADHSRRTISPGADRATGKSDTRSGG